MFSVVPCNEPGIVRQDNRVLRVERFSNDLSQPLTIRVENLGQFSRTFKASPHPALSFDPESFSLPPETEGQDVKVTVDETIINQDYLPQTIPLIWKTDQNDRTPSLELRLISPPNIRLTSETLKVEVTNGGKTFHEEVLLVLFGCAVEVKRVRCSLPWLQCELAAGLWEAQTKRRLHLSGDLAADQCRETEITIPVSIEITRRKEPIEILIRLQPYRPPRLTYQPSSELLRIKAGRPCELEFKVANEGDVEIYITQFKITLTPENDDQSQELTYEWCEPSKPPIILSSSQQADDSGSQHDPPHVSMQKIRLRLNTDNLAPDSRWQMRLTAVTDLPGTPQFYQEFHLEVLKPSQYQEVVAIDFGTTNTTCALYLNEKAELANLDPHPPENDATPLMSRTQIPSMICYSTFDDVLIGFDAKNYEHDPTAQVFASVKRFLGTTEPLYPVVVNGNRKDLTARDVVCDYFRCIKKTVEEEYGTWQSKVIITFPTKFAWFQCEDLRWIARELDIKDANLKLIDEARAVAYYALRIPNHNLRKGEEFLVFDVGGGTTDIALCQHAGDTFEVIDVAGDRRFGGDNITEFIVDALIHAIHLRFKPTVLYRSRLHKDRYSMLDLDTKERMQENCFTLDRQAEEIKMHWQEKVSGNEKLVLPRVCVKAANGRFDSYDKNEEIELPLEQVETNVRCALAPIIEEVRTIIALRETPVTKLLLAGQGSKFPVISDYLASELNLEVIPLPDLKAAVALGALAYGRKIEGSGSDDHVRVCTRSGFGLLLPKPGEPLLDYQEFIPKNTDIPTLVPGRITHLHQIDANFRIYECSSGYRRFSEGDPGFDPVGIVPWQLPPGTKQLVNLRRCRLVLRLLRDDSISLCVILPINNLDNLLSAQSNAWLVKVYNSYYPVTQGLRYPEDFHPEVIQQLVAEPYLIQEYLCHRRSI